MSNLPGPLAKFKTHSFKQLNLIKETYGVSVFLQTKEHKSVPKLQSAKVETQTQQTVQSLFQQRSPYPADSARATAISQSIADFLILDMKPLGTVEGSGLNK